MSDPHWNTIHSMTSEPVYMVWARMKTRCYNPNYPGTHRYLQRGIAVCEEWINDPKAFMEWALSNGYDEGVQIDRINNNAGYSPDNCRFVTPKVNQRNTSISKWWFIDGVRYASSTQAAKALGVSIRTINRWCKGSKSRGKIYQPKENCYSEPKYTNKGIAQ